MENYGLPVCLHTCSPAIGQIYLVGENLSERSGISSPVTVGIIVFYTKPNNIWGQPGKDGERCGKMLWNYFPYGVTVRNADFLLYWTLSLHILNISGKTDFERQLKSVSHLFPICTLLCCFILLFFWTGCDVQAHVRQHERTIYCRWFYSAFISVTTSAVGVSCILSSGSSLMSQHVVKWAEPCGLKTCLNIIESTLNARQWI